MDFNYINANSGKSLQLNVDNQHDLGQYSAGDIKDSVTIRRFKFSAICCTLLLIALAAAMVISYFQLQDYTKNAQTFTYGGVEYAFENNDKSAGSNIYVVGARNKQTKIVIEEKIRGHLVTSISSGAFTNNATIQTVIIKGDLKIESAAFYNCYGLKKLEIPKVSVIESAAFRNSESLTEVVAYNLTSLGYYAFGGCTNLTDVRIENSTKPLIIGYGVFANCTRLNSLEINQFIDESSNANFLYNCNNLKKLKLKNFNYHYTFDGQPISEPTTQSISNLYALSPLDHSKIALEELIIDNCTQISERFAYGLPLTSIEIGNLEIPEVRDYAFSGCTKLTRLSLPNPLTYVGEYGFSGVAITDFDATYVSYIGDRAFSLCERLTDFYLFSNGVLNYLGAGAFSGCKSLKSIAIPHGISTIRENTFSGCYSLKEVITKSVIISIGESAFYQCASLESFSFEETVLIERSAFYGCIALSAANFDQFLEKIGDEAFYNCLSLAFVKVPSNTRIIGRGAFARCESLQEITLPFIGDGGFNKYFGYIFSEETIYNIPQSLKKITINAAAVIANNAFKNCYSVEEIIINDNYSAIGSDAFENCYNLNNFVIPASVTFIDLNAFLGCYKLFELYNLSVLPIKRFSEDYGMAGYYALKIYNSLGEPLADRFNHGDFSFLKSDDSIWHLTNIETSEAVTLPQGARYLGNSINHYKVVKNLIQFDYTMVSLNVPEGAVSEIGDYAFSNCYALKTVTITDVKKLGFGTFNECTSLKQITLPFVGAIETAYKPEPLNNAHFSYIFGDVLYESSNVPLTLETVIITRPQDVPSYAFYNCGFIKSISLHEQTALIGNLAFYNSGIKKITLPTELTRIEDEAFSYCLSITEITLPLRLESIGERAFAACFSLAKVTVLDELTFENEAFYECFSLLQVVNVSSMPVIAGSTNHGYLAYYAVVVYDSLEGEPLELVDLGGKTFARLQGNWILVNYSGSSTNVSLGAFEYGGATISSYAIKSYAFAGNDAITNLAIGKEVKQIGVGAFLNCTSLTNVTISGLTRIAQSAFENCYSLQSVELPQTLQAIDKAAFKYCRNLYSIVLPQSLISVDEEAFYGCFSLCEIYNLSELSLFVGDISFGHVAYYALRVSKSLDIEPLQIHIAGGFKFMYCNEWWYLVSNMDGDNSLPSSFKYNSIKVETYALRESALSNSYFTKIFIPLAVSRIIQDKTSEYYVSVIQYGGSPEDWNGLIKGIVNSPLLSASIIYFSGGLV